MPTATIRSLKNSLLPITGGSRDDLAISDLVTVQSVNVGTAYQWSIAFKPDNPNNGNPSTAVFSSTGAVSAVTQNPGSFTVDEDGPYLIRLVYTTRQITLNAALSAGVTFSINGVTLTAVAGARTSGSNDFSVSSGTIAGITADMVAAINDGANSFSGVNLAATDASPSVIISPTVATNPTGETLNITYSGAASDVTITDLVSEQYVRLRALTAFGGLKLVAAGERYDTLRVPVDATASGWADEQNFNLTTLLSLVKTASASGNIFYVDPVEGDYQTIQAAMDAAQAAGPTITSQWVILVRPSIYEEDLTFYPYVNVFGWPGGETSNLVRIRNNTVASHTIAMAGVGFNLTLCNLYFEQPTVSVNPTILQTGTGTVRMIRCEIEAQGNTGESYSTTGPIELQDCRIVGNGVNVTDYAFRAVGTNAVVAMNRCTITGQSGLFIGDLAQLTMRDCEVTVTGTYAINTVGAVNRIEYSRFVGGSFGINPTAAGAAGNLAVDARWSELPAISIDGTAVVGSATLSLGSSIHGTLTTAGGATVSASVPADSVFYDNTTSGLTAANVQAALDEIYAYAALVRTLDDAYDGGVAGTGNGRRIIADQGAVEIVDAVAPSDPIPPGNANGNLDVVGAIRIGGVGKPELEVDPNPFGNGPTILMGREIWANDAPYGSTALILGNASGTPTNHNYNLRMGTLFADGGNQVGSVFLRGGDAQAAINAGGIYIQGGTAEDGAGGAGGSIYIAPGETASGADGRVIFVDQSTGTSATLTASGVFSGAAVAGTITLGTEMGAATVTFAGGEDLAATQALFNATGVVTAAGDPIVLTTVSKGPSAEVFFLNADAGVDASLGGFSGQAMAGGSWPSQMAVAVTGPDEITFGVGDPNPMIYDSSTGKLTVPGLIDPTGMIFDEAPQPATGAAKGAIFVGDGSGSTVQNRLYYADQAGTLVDLSTGGGGGSGDVVGPASAIDNALVRFNGTTGKLVHDSDAVLTDGPNGELILAGDLAVSPNSAGFDASARLDRLDATSDAAIVYQTGATTQWVAGLRNGSTNYTLSSNGGINERLKVDSTGVVTFNDEFSFPATDGSANQVLQTDGNKSITWVTPTTGDLVGPASSTDTALARFDGTTGKLLQNSNATLTTAGDLTLAGNLEVVKAAAVNSFVLIDRFDATVSSAVIHTTGGSNDWIVGVPGSGSDYTIADGASNGRLSVNSSGNVTVNPGSAGAFTLPNADGGANEYLQTDGAGNVSWAPAGGGGWPTSTGTDVNGIGYEMAELSAANSYIVLKPGSNGPIQTSVTDNAISGGNGRGLHATDWQRFRTSAGHVASGSYSIVAGGRQNLASQTDSTVSGGQANQATADQSTVSGGQLNTASGPQSAIGGGSTNQTGVAASYASIIGGRENSTLSQGSVCMGIRSRTFLSGQMVHASGTFSGTSSGDAQHGRMILRQVTANNKLELNANAGLGGAVSASDYLTLDNNTGHVFTLLVIARAEGSPSPQEDAWWSVEGCIIKENNAASTFMIGPALPTAPDGHRGTQSSFWRLFVTANTTDGRLMIEGDTTLGTFTGNVRWVATLQTTQVGV